MEQKPRVTLDSVGMRARPRPYLHAPERRAHSVTLVQDISRTTHATRLDLKPSESGRSIKQVEFVQSARRIVLDNIRRDVPAVAHSKPTPTQHQHTKHVQKAPVQITESSSTLTDLVTKIQTSREKSTIKHLIADDNSADNIHEEAPQKAKRSLFSKWSAKGVLASGMALLLMTGGLIALLSSIHNNKLVVQQAQALSEKADELAPDDGSQDSSNVVLSEDPIPEKVISNYSVSADMPKYISIPKLKIGRNRVLRMGLDKDGAIKVPRNVWDTGWYDGSAKPGDASGASLIVGHVNGPTNGGVFYNLYRVAVGDEIRVTMGDDTVYTYKVVQKEEVPLEDINMNNYLSSKDIDKPGLTLMTCSGEYNPKTQTYDKRLAVFAIRTN